MQRRLRVVDIKIRVLFVEQSPRWDYRYLQAVLTVISGQVKHCCSRPIRQYPGRGITVHREISREQERAL